MSPITFCFVFILIANRVSKVKNKDTKISLPAPVEEEYFPFNYAKEEYLLGLRNNSETLTIFIKCKDSLIQFEREFTYEDFIKDRVFLICDNLKEIYTTLIVNLKNPLKLSASLDEDGNMSFKIEISIFEKIFNVSFLIYKKMHDVNYLIEFLINENKILKEKVAKLEDGFYSDKFVQFENFKVSESYLKHSNNSCKLTKYEKNSSLFSNNFYGYRESSSQPGYYHSERDCQESSIPIIKNVKDLQNYSDGGILTNSPGWIIIEFTKEYEFEKIQISGYYSESKKDFQRYGYGASIETSIDMKNWKNVGSIGNDYGYNPIKIRISKSTAKFIKFTSSSYMGIGHLKIKTS